MCDLIIYSNTLDFYLKNFAILQKKLNPYKSVKEPLPLPVISFHIFPEDLEEETGKKIEKIIHNLIIEGIGFNLYPLPPCLFQGSYPKDIQNHHLKKNLLLVPAFFEEMGAAKYIYTKTDLKMLNQEKLDLVSKCTSCKLRLLKQCQGILQSPNGSYLCHKKVEEWLRNKMNLSVQGNLLDIGCGAKPPFLEFYKEMSLNSKMIYLLEPSVNSLMALRELVPSQYKNITIIKNTAERMSFKDNMFDIVVLISVYPHLQNLHQSLSNIKRILNTEGVLIIRDCTEPNLPEDPDEGARFTVHFRNHNLHQAISELEKCGFKVIDTAIENQNASVRTWAIKAKKII